MNYKSKPARLFISFLAGSFIFFSFQCKTTDKNIAAAKQQVYSIQLESSGYSDIKKMYSTDSFAVKKSRSIDIRCPYPKANDVPPTR